MKLAIVIVHYNSSADLDRCLESLAAYPPTTEHRIVVVDNASTASGLGDVQRRYPGCVWVMNAENSGYARGANRGMAAVDADYYLVLNPDIVTQPGALDRLLAFADAHPRAGMVGPQLLNEDGSVQTSCRRFYTFKTLLLRRTILGRVFPDSLTVRRHLMEDFDHESSRPVDWVLGGCLLVRRSAMERTGPMDERFFLYFEDVDWCYRMWQAGYDVVYTPDARFIHRHRRDSARRKFGRSWWSHLGSLISFYEKWGVLIWLVKKWRDPLLVFLLWAMDMAALAGSFGLAYGLRGLAGGLFTEPLFPFSEYRPLLVFALLLASVTFVMAGRYRPGRRRRRRPVGEHLQQVGVVALLLLAASYLGHLDVVSRAVLLTFIVLMAGLTHLGESIFRRLMRRLERENLSLERTLLVGRSERVGAWLQVAHDLVGQGVDIAGYVADPDSGGGLPSLGARAVPWLGRQADLVEVVRRYRISQVVFWDTTPTAGEAETDHWERLASLRRMRVRLRWQTDSVWLLAAGTRVDLFGGELGAVQSTGGSAAARVLTARLVSVAVGVWLAVWGVLPWLWLKWLRVPGRKAAIVQVPVCDVWGHDPVLTLAVGAAGEALPLGWQWRLAGPLIGGSLAVFGPRPLTGGRRDGPRRPVEVLKFWRSEPSAPGLTGRWCLDAESRPGRLRVWAAVLGQLLRHPGGFGALTMKDDGASAAGADGARDRLG